MAAKPRDQVTLYFSEKEQEFFSRVKYGGEIIFFDLLQPCVFRPGVARFVRFLLLLLNLMQHLFLGGRGLSSHLKAEKKDLIHKLILSLFIFLLGCYTTWIY